VIRIGTAGFSYKDWEGIVYPDPRPEGFRPLAHLARFFDCIEMNTTFYGVPKPATVERWVQEVADRPEFRFTFKLYRGLTHGTDDDSLQPYLEALEPCRSANKLGAILLQFPFFFKNTRPNRARLATLAGRLEGWPCAVEVRDDSWLIDPALEFMQRLRLSLCDIDICQAKHHSVPPASLTTGNIGYVRLHGRNAEAWFDKHAPAEQKYNYLYSDKELDQWVRLVREIAAQTHDTYVITNNHFQGKAVANAFSLSRRLTDNPPNPPDDFVEHYPHLRA